MAIVATSTNPQISPAQVQDQKCKVVSLRRWRADHGSHPCAQGSSPTGLDAGKQSCPYTIPPQKTLRGRTNHRVRIATIIWDVGCIIVSAAQNIPMLIVGRILNGFCVGICSAQVPVYISEVAPPSKRGRLIGAQQWAITWGIMIMFYISYGCSFISGPTAFRVPWALQMIPALI